jgi:hypothetical protein
MLFKLESEKSVQLDLFGKALHAKEMRKLYGSIDEINKKFGKHTVYLGSSFLANKFSQHLGERGDIPKRKELILKGESARKRLAIPMMFMGEVK